MFFLLLFKVFLRLRVKQLQNIEIKQRPIYKHCHRKLPNQYLIAVDHFRKEPRVVAGFLDPSLNRLSQ